MDKAAAVAQIIAPIFAAILLGMLARKKALLTPEENRGLQQFVIQFGMPCVVFNACLTADINREVLSSMALVLPLVLLGTLWAFRWGRKWFPYHNVPMLFAAQETGMLGIPLFIMLFGADQAYRMGVLDLTQAVVAYPVIAILTSVSGDHPSVGGILKKMFTSPLLLMSLLGLALNLSGVGRLLDDIGIGSILTGCTAFLAQPVSAVMIFSRSSEVSRSAVTPICSSSRLMASTATASVVFGNLSGMARPGSGASPPVILRGSTSVTNISG